MLCGVMLWKEITNLFWPNLKKIYARISLLNMNKMSPMHNSCSVQSICSGWSVTLVNTVQRKICIMFLYWNDNSMCLLLLNREVKNTT